MGVGGGGGGCIPVQMSVRIGDGHTISFIFPITNLSVYKVYIGSFKK